MNGDLLLPGFNYCEGFIKDVCRTLRDCDTLTHAQFIAVASRLKYPEILQDFKDSIDAINLDAKYKTKAYINEVIQGVSLYKRLRFRSLRLASKETHNGKKSVAILQASKEKNCL